MDLRLAKKADLPELKSMYKKLIDNMNKNGIEIWDDIYPCEFLAEDIEENRLYVSVNEDEIVSAFALCNTNSGAEYVEWEDKRASALYLDRLAVNVDYLRKGIAGATLHNAILLAKESGAEYLRLFAVDTNIPAIKLYEKNGFIRAGGVYDEVIDEDLILREFGYEIKI